jgi:hypothetical protein
MTSEVLIFAFATSNSRPPGILTLIAVPFSSKGMPVTEVPSLRL